MSTNSDSFERLLEKCAEEPIRVPGSIQPSGCLLAARMRDARIVYVSENIEEYLKRSPGNLLGQTAREVFGESTWNTLLENVEGEPTGRFIRKLPGVDRSICCTAHRSGSHLVCEIEWRNEIDGEVMPAFYEMQAELLDRSTVGDILQTGVESVAELTGYEHVMIYRFHSNWDGEVVAETSSPRAASYQGHRFPASDIPKQARELYRENLFRMIPDVGYEPVRILADTEESLDLSRAWLRSVSPVHLRYLENMGVQASLSLSIIVNDRMWGLIACHNPEPGFLSHDLRRLIKFYGRQFSTQISLVLEDRRQQYLESYQEVLQLPHRFLAEDRSLSSHLQSRGDELLELMQADGLILRLFGETKTVGEVPPSGKVSSLMEWLDDRDIDEIWYTDHLKDVYARADEIVDRVSGILVLELPQEGARLVWLRPEVIRTIEWGGNPYERVSADSNDESLSPRNSFATWKEQLEHQSEPWRPEQVAAVRVFRQHMLEAVVAEASRRRSEQLDVIHQILRHDIQNKAGIITAYADMLTDVEQSRVQRYARRISQAGEDTIALTKSAWALARVIRSGGEVERSSVDLNPLVEKLVESVDATHADAVITMESSETGGNDLTVMAGPLLDSVIRNLISNAIKHNDKDLKKVRVEIDEQPSTVQIRVFDNGPGVPPSKREHIFGEGVTRLEDTGMGIGLYLVRLITGQYDGQVWVEDNQPEGSIFTVELPKVEDSPTS